MHKEGIMNMEPPVSHSSILSLVRKIQKNLATIIKIKVHKDVPYKRYLTWRMLRGKIYMYDCGENYANVGMIASYEELMYEIHRHTADMNHIREISIKYDDDTKECFTF